MSPRLRITTLAMSAVVFLTLVLGARGIARDLAAPFEGLEQFARSRAAAAPEPENEFQEPVRHVDWDAPSYVSPAPRAKSKSKTIPRLALSRSVRVEAGGALLVLSTRQLAAVEFKAVFYDLSSEPDLETLSSALSLSESQKASVAALIDWRKWSLDTLAEVHGDADSKERINASFRDAVEALLDPDQVQKYKGVPPTRNWITLRAASALAETASDRLILSEWMQRTVSRQDK